MAGGVVGLAAIAAVITGGSTARAGAAVAVAPLDPLADITDVYTWMAGSSIELVMDVSPRDDGSHAFGPGVVYAFHLTSKQGSGLTTSAGTETRVIVQFASATSVQAWVTDAAGTTIKEYVTGDPSNPAGITSTRGKIRLFAGRRSDPRFFGASGVSAGLATLAGKLSLAQKDAAGCPILTNADTIPVRDPIAKGLDSYAGQNVMAIVVQIDKSLVNTGTNTAVAVWGSSHAGA